MITGKLYSWIRWIAQVLLPALGSLYFLGSIIWNLPSSKDIVGLIMIIDFCLGVGLWGSQIVYAMKIGQGDLMINEDEDGSVGMRLELDQTTEELVNKKEVRFKVIKNSPKQRSG